MTRRMVCGGLAGMVAKTATNPLDRIRMLSQTGEHGISGGASVYKLYSSILRNEGVKGLWAGNGANLLRVFPAKAVVFSTNDVYQGFFRGLSHTPKDQKLHPVLSFLAGGFAGMTATACTYPLDFARGRITGKLAPADGGVKKKHYNGIIRTMAVTVKDEGVLEKFDVSLEEAQHMIMTARVQLGWVDISDLEGAEAEDGDQSLSRDSLGQRECRNLQWGCVGAGGG